MLLKLGYLLAFVPTLVHSYAPTDSIQDADPSQSGYLPDHNINPSVVSSSWATLWKMTFNARETWYAKPLVYTPTGQSQILVTASNMNNIRILDAATGALINSRTLQPPFLQVDASCGDMPNFIGVAGTPIIDPLTDTLYLFSKGYKNGLAGPQGLAQGQYKFYALDVNTLQDKPGFPVIIDGHNADNDPTRYFVGGTVLQRPSLVSLQGVVVGAFGGHCDLFNYTGMLVAVSKTPGVGVTSIFATETSPGAPSPQPLELLTQNGGKAAIWQGGMGIVADTNRVFFVTGNGQGHENGGVPASGRQPLSTLDECVANVRVSSSGRFSLTDYFEPYEYINLDAADRDLGSAGVSLLDPSFSGTGVNRIAIAGGKSGKIYVMNADALGGFMQGVGGTDGVIQTLTVNLSIFGGPASYPLEGGYIYVAPVGSPVLCFAFSRDANGNPQFTLAGKSAFVTTGRAGNSVPTVTSYQGQPGTAIVWMTDIVVGLKAWYAVPVNGVLVPIVAPTVTGVSKFYRPVFGDGRVYLTDGNGGIYAAGPSQTKPLTCTPKPINFGSLMVGNSATQTVTCTAAVAIPTVTGCYIANPRFKCLNSSLPTGSLDVGAVFSFPIVWDLTTAKIGNAPGNPAVVFPGAAASILQILTSPIAKYASTTAMNIAGVVVNSSPFINALPIHVDVGGIVLGTGSAGLTSSFTIYNMGGAPLTLTGFAWDDELASKVYNNITVSGSGAIFANGFSSSAFPAIGTVIAAGGSLVVPVKFLTASAGSQAILLSIWSDGGLTDVTFSGSAAPAAVGIISTAVLGGPYSAAKPLSMNFGTVNAKTIVYGNFTLCNPVTSGAQLTITESTPPADAEVFAVVPSVDLVVGQKIAIGACAMGRVQISASFSNPNRPAHAISSTWSISTDGTNPDGTPFKQNIDISAIAVAPQVGVIFPNGTARYQYLGCYFDGQGRQLATQLSYTPAQQASNENGQCQKNCFAAGWAFAATEYNVQCWCGNQPPLAARKAPSDKNCNFACPGANMQACGGPGTWASIYYDISKWSPPGFVAPPVPSVPAAAPSSAPSSASVSSAKSSTKSSTIALVSSSKANVVSSSSIVLSSSKASSSSIQNGISSSSLTRSSAASFTSAKPLSSSLLQSSSLVLSKPSTVAESQISSVAAAPRSSTTPAISVPSSTFVIDDTLSSTITSSDSTPTPSAPAKVLPPGAIVIPGQTFVAAPSGNFTDVSGNGGPLAGFVGYNITVTAINPPTEMAGIYECLGNCSSTAFGGPYSIAGVEDTTCFCANNITDSATPGNGFVFAGSYQNGKILPRVLNGMIYIYKIIPLASLPDFVPPPAALSSSVLPLSSAGKSSTTLSTSLIEAAPSTVAAVGPSSASTTSQSSSSSTASPILSQYKPIGCYLESTTGRALTPGFLADDAMTLEKCAANCGGNYQYFGVEFGRECYCGNAIVGGVSTTDIACNMACVGNAAETCGGSGALSMYNYTIPVAIPPVASHPTTVGGYMFAGCYTEGLNGARALTAFTVADYTLMTNELCAATCAAKGSLIFGTEFGGECYCGNSLKSGSVLAPLSECTMACPGNKTEICGDSVRLSLYSKVALSGPSSVKAPVVSSTKAAAVVTPWSSMGCYSFAKPTASMTVLDKKAAGGMSPEICESSAAAFALLPKPTKYVYIGVMNAKTCLGATAAPSPAPTTVVGPKACTVPCKGNLAKTCGGKNMYNLYGPSGAAALVGGAQVTKKA